MKKLFFLFALYLFSMLGYSQTTTYFYWTGGAGADPNWTNPANWSSEAGGTAIQTSACSAHNFPNCEYDIAVFGDADALGGIFLSGTGSDHVPATIVTPTPLTINNDCYIDQVSTGGSARKIGGIYVDGYTGTITQSYTSRFIVGNPTQTPSGSEYIAYFRFGDSGRFVGSGQHDPAFLPGPAFEENVLTFNTPITVENTNTIGIDFFAPPYLSAHFRNHVEFESNTFDHYNSCTCADIDPSPSIPIPTSPEGRVVLDGGTAPAITPIDYRLEDTHFYHLYIKTANSSTREFHNFDCYADNELTLNNDSGSDRLIMNAGNINCTGTLTIDNLFTSPTTDGNNASGSIWIIMNGGVTQEINQLIPGNFNGCIPNLRIDNSAGVEVDGAVSILNQLDLTEGIISRNPTVTTEPGVIAFAQPANAINLSDNSFCECPVRKRGAPIAPFEFPVGKGNQARPMIMDFTAVGTFGNPTSLYTVEYIFNTPISPSGFPPNYLPNLSNYVNDVSNCEYWHIVNDNPIATDKFHLELSYELATSCTPFLSNPCNLVVTNWDHAATPPDWADHDNSLSTVAGVSTGDMVVRSGLIFAHALNDFIPALGDENRFTFAQALNPVTVTANITDETCDGNDGSIDLMVSGGSSPFTYNWTGPGGPYTTEDLTGLTSGTYEVTITDATGCSFTQQFIVGAPQQVCSDCPYADGTDPNYVEFNGGNYFVAAGDLVTLPNKNFANQEIIVEGTLDITNCDLIFDNTLGNPDIGITVQGTGRLIVNNATLRPCEYQGSWKGIEFLSTVTGDIHESLIINATQAIYINQGGEVEVSNNEFVNCLGTIFFDGGGAANHSFTGNTITINDDVPVTYDPDGATIMPAYTFMGVEINGMTILGSISQNNFVHSASNLGLPNTFDFVGVSVFGNAVVSENEFTNVQHAYIFTGGSNVNSFENNKVLYNSFTDISGAAPLVPITLMNNNGPVLIKGNELTNISSDLNDLPSVSEFGIYSDDVSNVIISENEINDFEVGIRFLGSGGNIQYNSIRNSGRAGIYASDVSDNLTVTGNMINSDGALAFNSIGLLYDVNFAPAFPVSIGVTKNCIVNHRIGIAYRNQTAVSQPIPSTQSNYIYNYTLAGLVSLGFSNAVIFPIGGFEENDFLADDPGVTFDLINLPSAFVTPLFVSTSVPLNTFGVTQLGASGNHDPGCEAISRSFTAREELVNYLQENYPLLLDGSTFNLVSDFASTLNNDNLNLYDALTLQEVLHGNGAPGTFIQISDWMQNNGTLDSFEKNWLKYNSAVLDHDYVNALNILSGIATNNTINAEKRYIAQTLTNLIVTETPLTEMAESDVQQLENIDDLRGINANFARQIVHMIKGDHPVIYDRRFEFEAPNLSAYANETNADVHIYPNPATDKITVSYVLENNDTYAIVIRDITGREVQRTKALYLVGEQTISLSQFDAGSYLISIEGKESVVYVSKLIKE